MKNLSQDFIKSREEFLKQIEKELERLNIDITGRPNWKEYFMGVAELIGLRSTCYNRKVGAVIVKDKRVVATGYNGAASEIESCFEVGYCDRKNLLDEKKEKLDKLGDLFSNQKANEILEELAGHRTQRYCRSQHAEENAITQASRLGIPIDGTDMFTTLDPCERCLRLIISNKLKKVYIGRSYEDSKKYDETLDKMLTKAKLQSGISFEYMKITDKTRLIVSYEMLKDDISRNRERNF